MGFIVILPYHLQLQEDHKDPCVLDEDNTILQESVENKSCSKCQKIMLDTIPDVNGVIIVKNTGVLMLFLELWRIGEDDNDPHDGS